MVGRIDIQRVGSWFVRLGAEIAHVKPGRIVFFFFFFLLSLFIHFISVFFAWVKLVLSRQLSPVVASAV